MITHEPINIKDCTDLVELDEYMSINYTPLEIYGQLPEALQHAADIGAKDANVRVQLLAKALREAKLALMRELCDKEVVAIDAALKEAGIE